MYDYRYKMVHASTAESIKRLKENGAVIVIASGRSFPLLGNEVLTKIPADYYITANGHSILDGMGREIFSSRFSFEQTEEVVRVSRAYDCGLLLKYNDHSYLYNRPEEMFEVFNNIGLDHDAFIKCPSMDHHQKELPIGFTLRGCEEAKAELRAHGRDYRIELFHDVTECDIFSPYVNKMTGLRKLSRWLNLDAKKCIAFGDSRNDIEMISWAGIGIAMGNSCQELKDNADIICGSSWENGISGSLKELKLV